MWNCFYYYQKFKEGSEVLTDRKNVIFLADEAHRSQYGLDAKLDREKGELAIMKTEHMF